MRRLALYGLCALSLSTFRIVVGTTRAEEASTMTVELRVYSGRSNPSWRLSAGEVEELRRRLTGLPRRQEPFVEGGLGYGGFVIHNPEKFAGLAMQLYVFNGVGIPEERGVAAYEDVHDLEGWLLRQARERGHGAILSALGKDPAP
jgi:hypothetical protein